MKRPDRRTAVLATAVILAILASILPLGVLFELQKQQALARQRVNASDYARWTAMRVERTLADAKQALLRAQAIGRTDCSPDHIRQMEQVILDAHSARHIGYFRNDAVVCSQLGVLSPPKPRGAADLDLGQGYRLSYRAQPRLVRSEPLIELRHGDYGVLIGRGQLTDLVGQNAMTLGVATKSGRVLELSGTADRQAVQKLLSGQRFGTGDRYIFASQPVGGLVAFTIADRHQSGVEAAGDWRYVLPIAFGISLALIGIIIWVSRLQLSLEKSMELAIRKREFAVHYQPITEIATGRCVAAEALVRWRRQDGRMVPPDQFIPLAEASGLISPLTDLVIEIVMAELGPLLRDNAGLHVSINIPASDMESGRFLTGLSAAIAKAAIEPAQVWLEVTERAVMNVGAAQDAIRTARAAGYRISIDDFGTGYSSLSLLEGLPLDALKIDKSFIDAIGRDAARSVVTPHIISMAHGLKLAMIAEGVETPEQEAYLKKADVQFGQGWLYAKALPLEEFRVFYRRHSGRNA